MGRIASAGAPPPARPDSARHERPATPFVARAVAADAYRRALALDPHFSPHADVALEVLGELGRGGMGVVYRVRDRRLGREAALKVLLHPPDHADVQRRFRREAEVTARLDHPAIPPVYEAGTDARGRHYMLMRLIEGESLAQKIAAHHAGREDAPASRELLEVLVKVGEAVAYAHGRGVLHRDLKPANVMVGRFGEVLVMDWGLARRLDRDGADDDALLIRSGTHLTLPVAADPLGHDAAGLTEAGTVLGTPGYMAPEQAIGGALDERTDVFALGAILVEILTGRPPVDGGTPLQRLQRTAAGKVEGLRERRPDLPPELHDLAAAALRRAPAERTARAEDLVADLRAFLAGAEVSTHRYTPRERALRAARRHPAHLVAGAAALVLAAVALAASAVQPRAVGEETSTGAPARTAARPVLVPPTAAAVVAARVGQHRVATATEHDQAGLARRAAGDLEGAVEAHTQALQLDRSLVAAYVNRGAARHELGELAAALDDYERAITLDPTCAMAFANRAVARRALGDLRAALDDADEAVRLEPDDAVARVNRGLIRQELGDLPGAIDDLTRALDLDPRQPVTWSHRGLAHQAAGDLWRAAADHDRAVALAPRDARLRVHRAITRRALGDLPGARDDADLAVELDPACAAAWNVRGLVLHEEGELTAAVQAFDRALTLDPTSAPVHHNRGLARRAAGDLGGAIADQCRAIELAPSLAVAWGARGCAREEQGDLEGARGDLDQALTLDPSWTEPLRCRAVVRAALGDLAGARADVDRLSELAPDAAEVVALRAELGL